MLAARLPPRARWLLGDSPLDWDFSRAAHPLEALPEDHAQTLAAILPNDWRELLIFGEDDYAEGGGAQSFLTVHTRTGEVFGVDGERDAPVYFLSSSVTAFVETFLLFDRVLRGGVGTASELAEAARAVDPRGFDRSEWRDLAQYMAALSAGDP